MNKENIRQQMLEKRLALSPVQRTEAEQTLVIHLQKSGILQKYKTMAGYLPMRGEVDMRPIMALMTTMGGIVTLPCIETGGGMVFRRWQPEEPLHERSCEAQSEWKIGLKMGKYTIPCPASGDEIIPELLLLPLLACDAQGTRLGAGGGHYDRTLAQPSYQRSYRVGVGFAFQLVAHLPGEAHDVRVHAFVSEQGVVEFKQS